MAPVLAPLVFIGVLLWRVAGSFAACHGPTLTLLTRDMLNLLSPFDLYPETVDVAVSLNGSLLLNIGDADGSIFGTTL